MKYHRSLLLASFLITSPAWALFDVQVLTGKRDTSFKSSGSSTLDSSGNELKAAAHLDPIPLVPIGFGLSLAQITWDDADKWNLEEITGTEIGLEVEAWFPLELFGLVPYAKLGYTLGGAYTAKAADLGGGIKPTLLYKPSGLYIAAGVRWEFLFRLGVMFELEKSTRTLSFDKFEDMGSVPASTFSALGKDTDADSLSMLLGVQAGI